MKIIHLTFLLVTAYVLSSCQTAKVFSDYDHNIDFSTYKNYLLMERLESDKIEEHTKRFIGSLISEQLNQRGLSENLTPDLIVKVMVITQQKEAATVTRNNDFYWGSTYYPYGWGIGTNVNRVSYNAYTEGTLVIDIIDRDDKQLVWQGIASSAFKGSKHRNEMDLRRMIDKIFSSYPIRKK